MDIDPLMPMKMAATVTTRPRPTSAPTSRRTLKKAAAAMATVFKKRKDANQVKKAVGINAHR